MKLLFSVPTGYHIRELILPLRKLLEEEQTIEQIIVITPAAEFHTQIFAYFSPKFVFYQNPPDVESHKQLFQSLNPDIVITNTVGHDELDYPILKAAQELHIKTLTFIASWDNVWKVARLLENKKPVVIADHVIVWNPMMRDHLQRIVPEINSNRISVIGAPRLDYFWDTANTPTKEQTYQTLGLTDVTRPLIHFSTTELYPMDYVVKAVRHAVDAGTIPGNPHLYASVHPGGNIENHRNLEQYGVIVKYSVGRVDNPVHPSFSYVPTEEGIHSLVGIFKNADVLINHSSTTALESIIADTPVINVKYGRPFGGWKWHRSMVYRDFNEHYQDLLLDGATYVVTNKHELVESTNAALQDPKAKTSARVQTLQRMITTVDGTARQKVLDVIKQQVQP